MEANGDGLAPMAPLRASEVARCASFGDEGTTFRSVDFGSLGDVLSEQQAVATQDGVFFKQAQTSFRSVVVHQGTDQVGPLLLSEPEGFVPVSLAKGMQVKAQAQAAQTPMVLLAEKVGADITVQPLPTSPVFELEPVSTFRTCHDGPQQLPSCVDAVLREVLSCGVELEASSAKWRCVHSSAFSYITFVVTVYSDGFDDSGKLVYVVEAQRRSGNVQDFFALYRAMRDTISKSADPPAAPMLSSPFNARRRMLAPPPPALLESLGMDLKQMHVASFRELLRLESESELINGHREAVRALAELTHEDGSCAALNEEAEDEGEAQSVAFQLCRRLVSLLMSSDVETASFAAKALAELSKFEICQAMIVKCNGVPALADTAAQAGSCDEVGLRRGSGAAVAHLAAANAESAEISLSLEDVNAVHRFVVTAEASEDKVLVGFAREAQTALGLSR